MCTKADVCFTQNAYSF